MRALLSLICLLLALGNFAAASWTLLAGEPFCLALFFNSLGCGLFLGAWKMFKCDLR